MLNGRASAIADHPGGTRSRYPLMTGPCVIDKAAVLAAGTYPAPRTATTPGRAALLSAPAVWAPRACTRPVRPLTTGALVSRKAAVRLWLALARGDPG
jgi:hypothetical protein